MGPITNKGLTIRSQPGNFQSSSLVFVTSHDYGGSANLRLRGTILGPPSMRKNWWTRTPITRRRPPAPELASSPACRSTTIVETRVPAGKREPATLAIFPDREHDGRLRLIVTDRSYSSPPRFGEDRAITGVYVAENVTWRLICPANIVDCVALLRRSYRFRPNHDELPATDPIRWRDQGNTIDPMDHRRYGLPGIHRCCGRNRGRSRP